MLFQQIILHIVDQMNEERSISAPFHLIRGKRSGQTIQDVKIYRLTNYFSLFPKLTKTAYDNHVQQMIQSKWLVIDEKGIPKLTSSGKVKLLNMPQLKLNGWLYRGNERIFFQRLSLVTQTLSHVHAKKLSFTPIQKDEKLQLWVRQFLQNFSYKSEEFINQYHQELLSVCQSDKLSKFHLIILSHRLTGYGVSGVTWQQLSHELQEDEIDLQILLQESLHILLDEISIRPTLSILSSMTEGIKSSTPLTDSAKKTSDLFEKGYTFEQISSIRQLKESTIEDHFVEMAMNGTLFSVELFFPNEDVASLLHDIKKFKTKKLRTLKELFPNHTYFQLRLLLAIGGDSN
ncbi:helix-turn-helix domain-containing protein [Paenisporosarcina quisquiliarum]|uniref:Helix-turn-helix domain-containing protein n=1 Tax=Paenisporosarcina quisquiliarum TaxID=365346 RepID=A0A9X3LDA3_9BACL|nr:helix-turn-helix domain-containing protein [Paenisporosarcina quisquiliarum]MCZ8535753.1 helix-turn-helix domain-containing protein [Paenisporosarcina quisquiliarum]